MNLIGILGVSFGCIGFVLILSYVLFVAIGSKTNNLEKYKKVNKLKGPLLLALCLFIAVSFDALMIVFGLYHLGFIV